MKISKADKRDCKEQKRLAEIEVEKMALQIDREFLEFKVEEFIKDLGELLCDRCIFRVFELHKQIILNEKLKGSLDFIEDRKPDNKLFDKLVIDNTKQCGFCLSKCFILNKQYLAAKNCEILMEKSYDLKEAKQKKLNRIKTLKKISLTVLILIFCYFIGDKQ
jgi:hypothetical protein